MAGSKMDVGPAGEQLAKNISTIQGAKRLQYKELSEMAAAAGRHIPPLAFRRTVALERRVDAQDLVTIAKILCFSVDHLLFHDMQLKAEYKVVAS